MPGTKFILREQNAELTKQVHVLQLEKDRVKWKLDVLQLENDVLKEQMKQLELNINALTKELTDEKFIYGARGD